MGDAFFLAGTCGKAPVVQGEKFWVYDPAGEMKAFGQIPNGIKTKVAHRKGEFEKPRGEWNTLELYTIGNSAVYVVNGKVVQVLRDLALAGHPSDKDPQPLSAGQLQLQCEGAEAYYRRVEIRPLTAYPAAIRTAAGFEP